MTKQRNLLMAVLLLPLFVISPAHGEIITVPVQATVSMVDDPYGVVPDIVPGDVISGEYTYDTTTPDQEPAVQLGFYPHATGIGQLKLTVGAYQVTTDSSQPGAFEIFIDDEYNPGMEFFGVSSSLLLPSNGATYGYAMIEMGGNSGSALESAALPIVPVDPALFTDCSRVSFSGMKDGQYFFVSGDMLPLPESTPETVPETRYEYRLNAKVTYLDDPNGLLAGKVYLNDTISAGFTYDTATPNSDIYPGEGVYLHAAGTGEVNVAFADVVLNSDPTADLNPHVFVFDSTDPGLSDHLNVIGNNILSNNSAIVAYSLGVEFYGNDTVLNSIEMPAGNLSLPDWDSAKLHVGGDGWMFDAVITSLELVQVLPVDIFPAGGTAHPLQHFDMALRINDRPAVIAISGVNNGQDISPYLAGCAILPKLDTTQSIVCPDTTSMLLPGANTLQMQLMLKDGNVLNTGVIWEMRE